MRAGSLDRRITLLEPTPGANVGGQIRQGDPVEHVVWAARRDRGGGERDQAATLVGSWQTRFTVRQSQALRPLDHTWALVDEHGREYDIESVAETGGRSNGWWIYAVARS